MLLCFTFNLWFCLKGGAQSVNNKVAKCFPLEAVILLQTIHSVALLREISKLSIDITMAIVLLR